MQNRELSWLTFNERVLDQGADETVPLLERLNFVSIFWSNLQEFFMVRVGSLTDLSLVKKHIVDSKSGMTPSEQLDAIYARCHELYPIQERTFEEVRRLLGERGVRHLRPNELDDEQRAWLAAYVHDNVMPFLSPQIINARHPFPHLENGALYVVVRLNDEAERQRKKEAAKAKADKDGKADKAAVKEAKKAKNLGAEGVTLGLVPMPRQCERVIALPGKGKELAVRPAGARHRDGGGRDILHVHREAHERHLRHPQRRPRCHRGLRRGRRGLPRAHEAHPEEALPPGPRAPGERAAAVDHAGEAAAGAP